MEKFYWEPDHDDRIGIVSGIFAPDGLKPADIAALVDTFGEQAVDFYGALRSQLYDDQIRQFVHQVGLENVARQVVNTNHPPTFAPPDFSLAHLIEVGHRIVREQRLVQTMRLGDQYNRALRERSGRPPASEASDRRVDSQSSNGDRCAVAPAANGAEPFYRAYQAAAGEPAVAAPAAPAAAAGPAPLPSSSLSPEILEQVQQMLAQGLRLGLEHADQRRFRTNAWQSSAAIAAPTPAAAIQALEARLTTLGSQYVRLIGIDPASKRRVWEQIIQRP